MSVGEREGGVGFEGEGGVILEEGREGEGKVRRK